MQALITTVWRGITWMLRGVTDALRALWDGIAGAFLWVAEWLATFVGSLIAALVEIVFFFAELAIGLLPDMPEVEGGIGEVSFLAQANAYLPVTEALALMGVWSAIFATIGIYKLVKLVSPVSS